MVTVEDITKLYIAMFGRAPEGEGLDYWYQQALANDWDITQLATNMYYAAIQYEDYAFLADPLKLVESIYENVLGKTYADDPEGINYWVGQIKSGIIPPGEVARVIIQTAENQYPDHPATKTLHNRVEIALYTAQKIPKFTGDFEAFKDFIGIVDDDPLTIQLAEKNVDKYWEQVKEEAVETADAVSEGFLWISQEISSVGYLARESSALYKILGSFDMSFWSIEPENDGLKIAFDDFYYDYGSYYIEGIVKVNEVSDTDFKVDVLQPLVISSGYLTTQIMGGAEIYYQDSQPIDSWVAQLSGETDYDTVDVGTRFDFEAENVTMFANNEQFDFEEIKGYVDFYGSTFEIEGITLFEGEEYSFRASGDYSGNFNLELQDAYGNSLEVHWADVNGNEILDTGDYLSASFDGEDISNILYDYLS